LLIIAKKMDDDGSGLLDMEFIKKLNNHLSNGGSYCFECDLFLNTVLDGRKHDFAKHYEYALEQCGGNKKKLNEWMNLK